MDNELISVIIPTYNRATQLKDALHSVFDQSYSHIETIVVDDGSTDDTRTYIQSLNHDILYIQIPHSGVSAARNRGIEAASGEWLAFLDSDDYWCEKKLERQLHYVHTVSPDHASHEQYLICHTNEIWIRNGKRINQGKKHAKHAGWFFIPSLQRCLISPSSVLIHRSIFNTVGHFDEEFEFVEDYDLWLRITALYPVGYIDEALTVKCGGHDDQLSKKIDAIERYRIRALAKIIRSETLSREFLDEALKVFQTKSSIYTKGCIKRGKKQEAEELNAQVNELTRRYTLQVHNQGKERERLGI
jgi:glycosyltransferase involved in cell wall biosynthesis